MIETISEYLKNNGIKYRPHQAVFELTNRCNHSCAYCYINRACTTELTTRQICDVLSMLSDNGVIYLNISGGEPFLREDILPILHHVFRGGFFSVAFNSNGSVITNEHISFLAEYRDLIQVVQFSVFSHDAAVHDAYCGFQGAFKRMMQNAAQLAECGIPVAMAINVLDFNISSFRETWHILRENGFTPIVSAMKHLRDNRHAESLSTVISEEFFFEVLRQMELEHEAESVEPCGQREIRISDQKCSALLSGLTIDAQGNARPCQGFMGSCLGSILGVTDLQTWLCENEEYRRIRMYYDRANMQECMGCGFERYCAYCPAVRYSEIAGLKKEYWQSCSMARASKRIAHLISESDGV